VRRFVRATGSTLHLFPTSNPFNRPAETRFETSDTLENPASIGRQDAALHGRQGCLPLLRPRTFDFSDRLIDGLLQGEQGGLGGVARQ
jgi:hypothetical protein